VQGATVKTYDTGDDAFNALAQGRVDAAITDFPVVAYAAAQKPGLKVAAEVPGNLELGLMFPKDNPALRDAFNAGLAEIRANGTYDQIYETWFGDAPQGGSSTTGTTTAG
jgi:ABC-type amino acid transport substrate-binding protein